MTIEIRRSFAPAKPEGDISALASAVDRLEAQTQAEARGYADFTGLSLVQAHSAVFSALLDRAKGTTQLMLLDGRNAAWRYRMRLYHPDKPSEPEWDTDPDADPDAMGAGIAAGLAGVAEELRILANQAHGYTVGLEDATLTHRLKSLRPTISRRGGNATWRVPYEVAGAHWLARVDVERVK